MLKHAFFGPGEVYKFIYKSLLASNKSQKACNELDMFDSQKGKRKVQRVPQLQAAALPRHQEEEEIDKN